MSAFEGISPGDYYDENEYSPNDIYNNTNDTASRIIATANDLLADGGSGSQFSHSGEAYACSELILSERHFSSQDSGANDVYGGRPVENHALLRYGRNLEWGGILEEYDITTAVSVGGVKHQLLQNRYFIEVIGNHEEISEAYVDYPDIATGRTRRRMMTSYDSDQLQRFLAELKSSHLQNKEAKG